MRIPILLTAFIFAGCTDGLWRIPGQLPPVTPAPADSGVTLTDAGSHEDAGNDGGLEVPIVDAGCAPSFTEQVRLPLPGMQPTDLVLWDFDGDGVTDILVVGDSEQANVRLFLGTDGGSFSASGGYRITPRTAQTPDGGIRWMRPALKAKAGDFNGDGRSDLVVSGEYFEFIRVLLSEGDGGFAAGETFGWGNPYGLSPTVADLNDDGRDDLVAFNRRGSGDYLFGVTSRADGGFEVTFAADAGRYGSDPAIADFDGDGPVDMLVTRLPDLMWTHDVEVRRGYGNGGFVSTPTVTRERMDALLSATATDVNADGRPDVILSGLRWWDDFYDAAGNRQSRLAFGYGSIEVLLNVGGGFFDPDELFMSTPWPDASGDPVVGDFNRNGQKDIASVAPTRGVAVWVDLKGPVQWTNVIGAPIALESADLNGDGITDVVTANRDSADVSILLGRCE